MSWESYLENIRSKPEETRKRIAFWSSFGITAIIFVFWLASYDSAAWSTNSQLAKEAEPPAKSLTASAGAIFTDIKDMFFSPKKVVYPEIEVVGGDK